MFCPSCAERSSAVSTAGFLGSDAEPLRRRLTRRRAGAMMVAIHGTAGGCPGAFSPPMTDGQRELDPRAGRPFCPSATASLESGDSTPALASAV
jgi:hypothetical protein